MDNIFSLWIVVIPWHCGGVLATQQALCLSRRRIRNVGSIESYPRRRQSIFYRARLKRQDPKDSIFRELASHILIQKISINSFVFFSDGSSYTFFSPIRARDVYE
jgi:hypothetical protein